MKSLPIELDVLFNRTLIALETANKSKFSKGKKTDAKIQQFIATQHDFRTWHDFIKSLKNKTTFNETTEDNSALQENIDKNKFSVVFYPELECDIAIVTVKGKQYKLPQSIFEKFSKKDIVELISDPSLNNEHSIQDLLDGVETWDDFINALKNDNNKEAKTGITNLDDNFGGFSKGELVVLSSRSKINKGDNEEIDFEAEDFTITKENAFSHKVDYRGNVFIIPNIIVDKLSKKDILNLFSECYSSKNVYQIQQDLVLKTTQLEKAENTINELKLNKNEKEFYEEIAKSAQPHRVFNQEHRIFDLKDSDFERSEMVVDIGYKTLDIFRDKETSSTVNMQGKSFIVPNTIVEKLTIEELFDLLSGCYSGQDVRKINEELAFTKMSVTNNKKLLESCEIALEESQEREMDNSRDQSTIVINSQKIKVDNFLINNILKIFGQSYMYLAVDKDGGLWAYDVKPVLIENQENWTCHDMSNFNAMPICQINLEGFDWTKTVSYIGKK